MGRGGAPSSPTLKYESTSDTRRITTYFWLVALVRCGTYALWNLSYWLKIRGFHMCS